MTLSREITKKCIRPGWHQVYADGKPVGQIMTCHGGWRYFHSNGGHRACHTLRAAFRGAANYLNGRLPQEIR